MADNYLKLVFTLVLLLSLNLQSNAQENKRRPIYEHFKIKVTLIGDTVKLSCKEGCAWQELSFSKPYALRGQAINQYGMTKVGNLNLLKKDDEFADFLLTINHQGDQLIIKGNKGVHWENLILPCVNGCEEFVSERGTKTKQVQEKF